MTDRDLQPATPHVDEAGELQAHHDKLFAETVTVGNIKIIRSLLDQELRHKVGIYLDHYAQRPGALNETEHAQLETLKEGGLDAYEKLAANHILGTHTEKAIAWATEEAINREAGMIDAEAIIDGMYRAALERDAGERADSNSCRVEELGDLSSPTFTAQKEGGCGFVKGS